MKKRVLRPSIEKLIIVSTVFLFLFLSGIIIHTKFDLAISLVGLSILGLNIYLLFNFSGGKYLVR